MVEDWPPDVDGSRVWPDKEYTTIAVPLSGHLQMLLKTSGHALVFGGVGFF